MIYFPPTPTLPIQAASASTAITGPTNAIAIASVFTSASPSGVPAGGGTEYIHFVVNGHAVAAETIYAVPAAVTSLLLAGLASDAPKMTPVEYVTLSMTQKSGPALTKTYALPRAIVAGLLASVKGDAGVFARNISGPADVKAVVVGPKI